MRNKSSSTISALSKAADVWNSKVVAFSAPVLQHIFASVGNLQRLRAVVQQWSEVHAEELGEVTNDTSDHTGTLKSLAKRLDALQATLARLDEDAAAAAKEGEALAEALLALPRNKAATASPSHLHQRQTHAHSAREEIKHELDANIQALKRLIDTRKSDIEILSRQLTAAERLLAPRSGKPTGEAVRSANSIDLHNVQEFVQNAPAPPLPIQLSHYQRILEVANASEGRKVPMGTILTAAGIVTDHELQSALNYQRSNRRRALGIVLVDLGYTTEDAIAQALAAQLSLPYVLLANEPVNSSAVATIPVRIARRHACFPLNFTGHALCVAMANPLDLIALEDLRIAARNHIRPCVATRSDIVRHIERYYP